METDGGRFIRGSSSAIKVRMAYRGHSNDAGPKTVPIKRVFTHSVVRYNGFYFQLPVNHLPLFWRRASPSRLGRSMTDGWRTARRSAHDRQCQSADFSVTLSVSCKAGAGAGAVSAGVFVRESAGHAGLWRHPRPGRPVRHQFSADRSTDRPSSVREGRAAAHNRNT